MQMKRIVATILCVICILALPMNALAEGVISPHYNYTNMFGAELNITGGIATTGGILDPRELGGDQIVNIKVMLQKKSLGVWLTLETWRDSRIGGPVSIQRTKAVDPGFAYRTYVIGTISTAEGEQLERVTGTSRIVEYGTVQD